MFTLYRNTMFTTLLNKDEIAVMSGTFAECEAKAEKLNANGFYTSIR